MKLEPILGKPENKRAIKGYAILAKGNEPKQIKENVFRVPFQNSEKHYYVTTNKNGKSISSFYHRLFRVLPSCSRIEISSKADFIIIPHVL